MVRDRDGEPVAPEDVLDPAELADYYNVHGWSATTQMLSWPWRESDGYGAPDEAGGSDE